MDQKANNEVDELFLQSFYRPPWNKEKVQYVIKWFPHFGTHLVANELGVSRQQVKSKVDRLKLKKLPKEKRLCPSCRERFQMKDYDSGHRSSATCKECHLKKRKLKRQEIPQPTTIQWIKTLLNTKRYQANFCVEINAEYLLQLWINQNGRCWYSGIQMSEPRYGSGRNLYTASIDRIDSNKGYVEGNVVWATWICNAGKNSFSESEYIELCKQVVNFQQEKLDCGVK